MPARALSSTASLSVTKGFKETSEEQPVISIAPARVRTKLGNRMCLCLHNRTAILLCGNCTWSSTVRLSSSAAVYLPRRRGGRGDWTQRTGTAGGKTRTVEKRSRSSRGGSGDRREKTNRK